MPNTLNQDASAAVLHIAMHSFADIAYTALKEATGGAAAGVVADGVLYGIDSAKIRAQQQGRQHNNTLAGSSRASLYRGLVPTVLLGSVPVFGVFFLLYAPIRDILIERYDRRELLPLASALCAIPATIVGVPADVLKKRLILGHYSENATVRAALTDIIKNRGWKGLFAGWHVNLIRDLPFAGVKIGLYDIMVQHYQDYYQIKRISPLGASLCGVGSGVACAVVTCPLDVINTTIKATGESNAPTSIFRVGRDIVKRDGVTALFRGAAMRSIVLAIGSSIFWPIQQGVARSFGSETFNVRDMLMEVYH